MKKMWSGRFSEGSSSLLEQFNGSIMFDRKLYREDIEGSVAHAKMLFKQGILTQEECASIEKGMAQVLIEIESGEFQWKIEEEDLHMAIEKRLTELIGDAGKKLHTARSRNDQVALDFRRYVLRKNKEISLQIKELMEVVVKIAKENTDTLLPGMTHLQHAQPINFGFHDLENKIVLLSESEITGVKDRRASATKLPTRRKKAIDPLELKPGDFVVHEQHGIGRYVEMIARTVGGITREITLSNVDFPEPFLPTIAKISPELISNETLSNARNVWYLRFPFKISTVACFIERDLVVARRYSIETFSSETTVVIVLSRPLATILQRDRNQEQKR